MDTADTFFLPVKVNDKRGGIRVCVDDHEGSNGIALQLVLPIVVGRVYVVTDIDVRIAGCDPMVEVTFVLLLRLTQGHNYDGDLLAKAGHEFAFASERCPIRERSLIGERGARGQVSNPEVGDPPWDNQLKWSDTRGPV